MCIYVYLLTFASFDFLIRFNKSSLNCTHKSSPKTLNNNNTILIINPPLLDAKVIKQ